MGRLVRETVGRGDIWLVMKTAGSAEIRVWGEIVGEVDPRLVKETAG